MILVDQYLADIVPEHNNGFVPARVIPMLARALLSEGADSSSGSIIVGGSISATAAIQELSDRISGSIIAGGITSAAAIRELSDRILASGTVTASGLAAIRELQDRVSGTITLPPPAVTWDPTFTQSGQTLSNGNLTISATSPPAASNRGTQSTTSHTTGKFYMEFTDNTGDGSLNHGLFIGVCDANCHGVLSTATNYTYLNSGFGILNNGIDQSGITTFAAGDVIGVAFDLTSGGSGTVSMTWFKNNTSVLTKTLTGLTAPYFAFAAAYSANSTLAQGTANFGATAFSFTPPTGFVSWQ